MTSDPFEEFEFRPLNEGLGFHRRSEKKAAMAAAASAANDSLPEIEMPIGSRPANRRAPVEDRKAPESTSTVDDILKTLQTKRKIDFTENQRQAAVAPAYRTSKLDLSALVLDGMLVTAASLACLIVLLLVTKIDLFGMITQTEDVGVYVALYSLFAGVAWIYLLMNRMFLGFTPGEWVFDQRIGMPQQLGTAEYSLRLLARATLVVFTGLVIVPALSLIMQTDLAGKLTKTELLKKV